MAYLDGACCSIDGRSPTPSLGRLEVEFGDLSRVAVQRGEHWVSEPLS